MIQYASCTADNDTATTESPDSGETTGSTVSATTPSTTTAGAEVDNNCSLLT